MVDLKTVYQSVIEEACLACLDHLLAALGLQIYTNQQKLAQALGKFQYFLRLSSEYS